MSQPRNPANARHATQVRLPAELLDRIDEEARVRVLGRNRLIELLLRLALDHLPPLP